MDADAVLHTLRQLRSEQSSDVPLLKALAGRFRAHAEEFFPPQVDELLGCFAALSYYDDSLLEGFAGRLDDVMMHASPRRVVRVLRYGATLQMPPEPWMGAAVGQLQRHLPSLQDGIPSILASLRHMRWLDPTLVELLMVQGMINTEQLGDAYFARVFERWSRHGVPSEEALQHAAAVANEGTRSPKAGGGEETPEALADLRDGLNLFAGLFRFRSTDGGGGGGGPVEEACHSLEGHLTESLRRSAPVEVAAALSWMRRITLRHPSIWQACADGLELSLEDEKFVRASLPHAIHALAALTGTEQERRLVQGLIRSKQMEAAIPKLDASQALQLLQAACLVGGPAEGSAPAGALPWLALTTQALRLSRQLTLPERRLLSGSLLLLEGSDALGEHAVQAHLRAARSLPTPTLPPVAGNAAGEDESWLQVDVGPEALLQPSTKRKDKVGFRFAALGDVFSGAGDGLHLTPTGRAGLRVFQRQGWEVELRP